MQLLSYLHDPDDLFVPLINQLLIPECIRNTIVAISPQSTQKVKDAVKSLGLTIIEGGLYGTARLNLLKYAIDKSNEDYFFLCDFDKLIHWLSVDQEELCTMVNNIYTKDYISIARSARALATYPETWLQTEYIATKILSKIIKQNIDFMNGPCVLSKQAAGVIVENGKETGVGSCVEIPLLTYQAGLSIENIEVNGLTWEDPDRYPDLINKAKSFDDWKYDTFGSLYEWRKRVDFLHAQAQTMIRLTEEPINPKYPAVHNKIFENRI